MTAVSHYLGIDCSKDHFAAAIFKSPETPIIIQDKIDNIPEGFDRFCSWLTRQGIGSADSLICIENTGVYSEALCCYLANKGFFVALEAPQKVKQAFKKTHKTDPVDASQIAEYAYRYTDRLKPWKPKSAILQKINSLLTIREQLVCQRTALKNIRHALQRKIVQSSVANDICQKNIELLTQQIKELETEMKRLLATNTPFAQMAAILDSGPGIGMLLALNLLVETNAFTEISSYTTLAAYLGICPLQHQSGSSIQKRSRSTQMGPARIRKLLHLAARSLAAKNPLFKQYFLKKLAQGKPKLLIYNNIANKIIRIACALVSEGKYYDPKHISINPILLKSA